MIIEQLQMNTNSGIHPLRSIFAAGEGLLDRALCIVGAVLFAQTPEFIQQYLQRLGGRLDEARRQLAQLNDVAVKSGLTLDQLVADTASSSDPAVVRLGGLVHATASRVDSLATADEAIRHASLFTRPFVFFRHFDPSIARATASIFRPAVPTTLEGLLYAILGMVILLCVYHFGVKYPVRRAWRARAARRAQAPGTAVSKA